MNQKKEKRAGSALLDIWAVTIAFLAMLLTVGYVFLFVPDLRSAKELEAAQKAQEQAKIDEQKRQEAIAEAERKEKEEEEAAAYAKTKEGILSDGIVTFDEIYTYAGEQYKNDVKETTKADYGGESLLDLLGYCQVNSKQSCLYAAKFTFAFADDLYSRCEVKSEFAGLHQELKYEYSNTTDGSYLAVGYDMISTKESEKQMLSVRDALLSGLTDVSEENYTTNAKRYYASCLYYAKEGNLDVTVLVTVDNSASLYLILKYPHAGSDEDRMRKEYYRYCILNYCSFYESGEGKVYLYDKWKS